MRPLILAGAVAGLLGQSAFAAAPPKHAAYLHALHDLRLAVSNVGSRGGDQAMEGHEKAADAHIHAAADLVREIAPEVHKDILQVPAADTNPSAKIGKLHDAAIYLGRAHADISEPESDPKALGLQKQALSEIDAAASEVQQAISAFQAYELKRHQLMVPAARAAAKPSGHPG